MRACGHVQLLEQMVNMILDGRFRNIEDLSDFLVRFPLANSVEHLPLALGDRLWPEGRLLAAVGDAAEKLRGDSRRAYEFLVCDALDRPHEILNGRFGGDVPSGPRFRAFHDICRNLLDGECQNLASQGFGAEIANKIKALVRRNVHEDDVGEKPLDVFASLRSVRTCADDNEPRARRKASGQAFTVKPHVSDDEDARPGRTGRRITCRHFPKPV